MPIVEYNNDLDTDPPIDYYERLDYNALPEYLQPSLCECFVNEQRIVYDICGSNSRLSDKKTYEHICKYIGSGYTFWVNGNLQISDEEYNFFVKYKENERRILVEKTYKAFFKTLQL